jgi:predicted dehydrogenase
MGARLVYAKVVDREVYMARGGKVSPHLSNGIVLHEDPGAAGAFLVLRAWTDHHGTFTEQWRIEGSGGGLVYESVPREIHLAAEGHTEHLEDEVADLEFEYAADDYNVVFSLDDREVARVTFPVLSGAGSDDA